jgi:sugar lactone lactonase YvrE
VPRFFQEGKSISEMRHPYLRFFCEVAAVILAVPAVASESAVTEQVVAESGWKYRVAAENLPGIDNLVMAPDGSLYATQELPNGAGKVIRLQRGEVSVVASGFSRPDGLLLRGKLLFITEEVSEGRVLEFDLASKKQRVLATLHSPEGIDILPDGDLVVSEDNINGRLLRVPRDGKHVAEVILGGLNRPEGLVARSDGAVIFAETATGRVLSYKSGEVNVVVDDLDEPDQVEIAPDGSLWITEDTRDGRLLRLKDGALETVLSGLRSPQGMAFGSDDSVWLAERGRRRVLVIQAKDGR